MTTQTPPLAPGSAFLTYMESGFPQIAGWPGQPSSVIFMAHFKELFERHGVTGGACEIGVHHGKYLIALHNILAPARSLGIDVFDDQDKNVDGSGKGSYDLTRAYVDSFVADPDSVALMSKDSLTLNAADQAEILAEYGRFAFFSIDGGHTAQHITYDFFLASELTSPYGIIAVDDMFHPDWPGVTEGILAALATRRSPFVPLFLTRKKLMLCHFSVAKPYHDFILGICRDVYKFDPTMVTLCGHAIPSLNFGSEY
ncbi:class I SAM-dependent methyltransferase [Paramagnetospirillum kuznetsovii]|uniref:class I SAM-dependent methyltransferase n=1 Tax=Paramagnetospirillum kuznetsovii TaxID=2053833 RepID=UPI0011BD9BA5|nr:class I SAM-dependent methyltransferase [Paramagnetospirillum kuznetsovii]